MQAAKNRMRATVFREIPGGLRRSSMMRQVAQEIVPHVQQLEAAVVRATMPRRLGDRGKVTHTAHRLVVDGVAICQHEMEAVRHRLQRVIRDGCASVPRPDGPGSPVYPDDMLAAEWLPHLGRQLDTICNDLIGLGRMARQAPIARVERTAAHRLVGAVFTVPCQLTVLGRPVGEMLGWMPTFFGIRPHALFSGVGDDLDHIGARPVESLGFGALVLCRALAEPGVGGADRITMADQRLLPHSLITTEDGGVRLHSAKRRNDALPAS